MDKRPKRRKHRDNPYELISSDKQYLVSFKDSSNQIRVVEVNKSIYKAFDNFELDDLSFLNEYDRHIEHFDFDENFLYLKGYIQTDNVESQVETKMQNEELYLAINQLSDVQKRRIKMYYFEDKTLQEIAKIENVHFTTIKESIDSGIKKLKNLLK